MNTIGIQVQTALFGCFVEHSKDHWQGGKYDYGSEIVVPTYVVMIVSASSVQVS